MFLSAVHVFAAHRSQLASFLSFQVIPSNANLTYIRYTSLIIMSKDTPRILVVNIAHLNVFNGTGILYCVKQNRKA